MYSGNKRKTLDEWIRLFKHHEYYELWKRNIPEDRYQRLTKRGRMSWVDFISESFVWSRTPEGEEFWVDLAINKPEFKKEIYYV